MNSLQNIDVPWKLERKSLRVVTFAILGGAVLLFAYAITILLY